MVVTDLPFERNSLIHSRYSAIRPESAPPLQLIEEEQNKHTKDYAAFLKDQERRVGPEGFLDSGRFTHTFHMKQKKDKLHTTLDMSRPSAVLIASTVGKNGKDHEKRLKVIEDHMWQYKQEERELKRVEGDILKNQRAVRNTLRDFENAINKKRMEEEKKLSTGMEKYTNLKRDHRHKKQEVTKQRIEQSKLVDAEIKNKGLKMASRSTDLARQYRTKMSEIELKRIEVMRLSNEFESKLRQKEEEEFKLKLELGELAITLNMETQKAREEKIEIIREKKKERADRITKDRVADGTLENKLMKSDGDTKTAESSKRKLDSELVLKKLHLSIRKRDEQRHLADTQIRMGDNTGAQRQLNEAAFHAELDKKSKAIDQKVEVHDARRVRLLSQSMTMHKEKGVAQQEMLEARFKKRYVEQQRKTHEDSLKFFQKMVTKEEEIEHSLYSKIRNAEYSRQKQEQTVKRLKNEFLEMKRKNAAKLKEDMTDVARYETKLEQKFLIEKAKLDKLHSQREESYMKVQQHWQLLKEDKHRLKEHEQQHNRLLHIGSHTDTLLADVY